MKREADGEMGSPQKRSRRGDDELSLLIPSKVAGSIIGKGGKKITKLRSQYKASITVPDCPGPERILTLSSDLDTICNIVKDIVPHLEENGINKSNANDLELRMLIHQSQAGCVIGKGGAKVKEIREKTGAHVKIFSKCAPQSTDRIIQIIGDANKCIDTIREIISLIKGSPVKGPVNPYDPHNYDDFYANEYGGYGGQGDGGRGRGGPMGGGRGGGSGGGGGGGGGGSGDRFNNRGSGPPPFGAPRGGGGLLGGPFNDRPLGGGLGVPSGGTGRFGGPPSGMNGGGSFERNNGWGGPLNGGGSSGGSLMNRPPSLGSGPSGGGPSGGGGGGGRTSTQVTIPKDLAGAIIGKGGGRIRQIRMESGAGITIDEPLMGSNDRIITITGSPNQIQMAQYLLQQSVHNNSESRNNY